MNVKLECLLQCFHGIITFNSCLLSKLYCCSLETRKDRSIFVNVCMKSMIFLICRLYSAQDKPNNLNERFAWFFFGLNLGVIIGVSSIYPLLGTAFSIVPKKYQWILALTTPLVREFWVWIGAKVAFKASGTMKASTKYICQHYMETKHAVFLAVILGGVATTESTYCILALDFAINLYHTIRIIKSGGLTNEKSKLNKYLISGCNTVF